MLCLGATILIFLSALFWKESIACMFHILSTGRGKESTSQLIEELNGLGRSFVVLLFKASYWLHDKKQPGAMRNFIDSFLRDQVTCSFAFVVSCIDLFLRKDRRKK